MWDFDDFCQIVVRLVITGLGIGIIGTTIFCSIGVALTMWPLIWTGVGFAGLCGLSLLVAIITGLIYIWVH